ncbi:hypothetical protein E5D57_013345 [Metarhizium anisopliae]|nr:hypothetical protein E5D57_013345 [Metarhizium anisopliae]
MAAVERYKPKSVEDGIAALKSFAELLESWKKESLPPGWLQTTDSADRCMDGNYLMPKQYVLMTFLTEVKKNTTTSPGCLQLCKRLGQSFISNMKEEYRKQFLAWVTANQMDPIFRGKRLLSLCQPPNGQDNSALPSGNTGNSALGPQTVSNVRQDNSDLPSNNAGTGATGANRLLLFNALRKAASVKYRAEVIPRLIRNANRSVRFTQADALHIQQEKPTLCYRSEPIGPNASAFRVQLSIDLANKLQAGTELTTEGITLDTSREKSAKFKPRFAYS